MWRITQRMGELGQPTVVVAYGGLAGAAIEVAALEAAGCRVLVFDGLDDEAARAAVRGADALLVTLHPVDADLLGQMGHCRIVTRVGTGVDAIDIPAATARGIWVTNVPDYSIDEVSTHALALLLALWRNLPAHIAAAGRGEWRYLTTPQPILRLRGRTLGILGCGRIGGAMVRKGLGIGFRVIACDPYIPSARIRELGAEPVDLATLLAEADALSLHVPLNDTTRRLIDAAALARLRPSAFLVNTARGEVVDIDALVVAVRAGRLAGAALDVLPTEPPPPDHPVLHEPRILVTPHIAWASAEAAVDVRERAVADVLRALRGERPIYALNEVEPDRARALAGTTA